MPIHQTPGQAGKLKNCAEWALYEPKARPGMNSSANMCNGGWYDGDRFPECPSRLECKRATDSGERSHNPFGGSRVIGTTANARIPSYQQVPFSLPTKKAGGVGQEVANEHPRPVVPPEDYPKSMQTPFVHSGYQQMGGMTPTFLPDDEEGVFTRLVKNMGQGAIGSSGWHIFDLARSVDFFKSK